MEQSSPSASRYLHEGRGRDATEPDVRTDDRAPIAGTAPPGAPPARRQLPGEELAEPAHTIEPPSVPDGTFVKVRAEDHPLERACEVTVEWRKVAT